MSVPNATMLRFGYPDTLVANYDHWVVLLRPEQPTLGSLILAARSDAQAFGALAPQAHAELAQATADIERALAWTVSFEKINYLMLMMVDPHVHFHVIPRYSGERTFEGVSIADQGWPKAPQLAPAASFTPAQRSSFIARLKANWA